MLIPDGRAAGLAFDALPWSAVEMRAGTYLG